MSTFEALLDGVDPALVTIARKLRALVRSVDPKTVETVRLGDNAITFGVGPRKMLDGYAYVMPPLPRGHDFTWDVVGTGRELVS